MGPEFSIHRQKVAPAINKVISACHAIFINKDQRAAAPGQKAKTHIASSL